MKSRGRSVPINNKSERLFALDRFNERLFDEIRIHCEFAANSCCRAEVKSMKTMYGTLYEPSGLNGRCE